MFEKATKIGDRNIADIAKEILDIVQNEESIYDCFGIRWDNAKYYKGDKLPNSHELFQDQCYDEDDNPIYPEGTGYYEGYYDAGELSGTCAIYIDYHDSLEKIKKKIEDSLDYCYKKDSNFYLIQGLSGEGGLDIDEIIISEAFVGSVLYSA